MVATAGSVEPGVKKILDMAESQTQEKHGKGCSRDNEGDNRSDNENAQNNVNRDANENREDSGVNNDASKQDTEEGVSASNKDNADHVPSVCSSVKSSQLIDFDEARCSESLGSFDSNKENFDSNSFPFLGIEIDSSDSAEKNYDNYDKPDLIPLTDLLTMPVKKLVSGFEFGEATKRRAQENMKTARDKTINEKRKSGEFHHEKEQEVSVDKEQPCCSKTLSESDHKTPHSHKRQRTGESKGVAVHSEKDFTKENRQIPRCLLNQPNCIEVWVYMIYKEEASSKVRNPRLFNDFKSVTPRMRAILLDWLMEVAEVYHLRRVTYYLSVDYFDRFLSIRPDIPKSLLQLVGITCLYIAAKVEEIYPPNLSEFSYVCDGACKAKEMVSCELLILNSLGWEVILTTPSDWLNLYMQLHFKSKDVVRSGLNMDFNKDFMFPQYSAYQFTQASQLMDLLSLDPGYLKFSYRVIAAAAMYYVYDKDVAFAVSGLTWQELGPCVEYMESFYSIVNDASDPRLHSCLGGPHPEEISKQQSAGLLKNKTGDENYSFQTHVSSMDYFEKAIIYQLTKLRDKARVQSSNNNSVNVYNNNVQSESGDKNSADVEGEDLNETNEDNGNGLVEDIAELTKNEDGENLVERDLSSGEQNLMSLDEIFEFILNQDNSNEN